MSLNPVEREQKEGGGGLKVMDSWNSVHADQLRPVRKKPSSFLPPDRVKIAMQKEVNQSWHMLCVPVLELWFLLLFMQDGSSTVGSKKDVFSY